MRYVLLPGLLAAVSVSATSLPTLRVPAVRAITVTEQSGSYYTACTELDLYPTSAAMATEFNDCATKSTYDWNSLYLPTITQRLVLCNCKLLMRKVQTLVVPHCSLYRDGEYYSYKSIAEYAFGLCSTSESSSSTSSSTTATSAPAATSAPVATPAPYTYTPYTYTPYTYSPSSVTYSPSYDIEISSSRKKSKNKTGLIVGLVSAAAVCSAIAAFVVRRRRKSSAKSVAEDENVATGDHNDVDKAAPLSPLGGDALPMASAPYMAIAVSPMAPEGKKPTLYY